jgi:hypothetical protein
MPHPNQPKPEASKPVTKAFIGYCPELKLYRYVLDSGEEQRFTHDELISSMVALEEAKKMTERDYLAFVTGLARNQPHMKVEVEGKPVGT